MAAICIRVSAYSQTDRASGSNWNGGKIPYSYNYAVYDRHVVIIFDECHRSQFGDMHAAIVKNFKKYHLFGFIGTPIFTINANRSGSPRLRTTGQTFGDQLHTYTIVDAINDKNVLPFHVDYYKTMGMDEEMIDEQVWDINREKAYMSPQRIELVTRYILNSFDAKTCRGGRTYFFNALTNISKTASAGKAHAAKIRARRRLSGFNSIFAVASVPMAKLYYEDTSALDESSRDFLARAIEDYNEMFHTSYDTSSDKFQNYYKDVSLRMKNREIDLLIVVNMFLTGFDAATLNTLWVDKNLKMHGLIQAFSRTNRILNSIKTFGNIVCFRNLQKRVDDAIALFGDRGAGGIVLLLFSKYSFFAQIAPI